MPSSAFLIALAFFSFVLLVAGAAVEAFAFFWSNFACFSAFLRSLSTAQRQFVDFDMCPAVLKGMHTLFLALHFCASLCSSNLAARILSRDVSTDRAGIRSICESSFGLVGHDGRFSGNGARLLADCTDIALVFGLHSRAIGLFLTRVMRRSVGGHSGKRIVESKSVWRPAHPERSG